MKKKTLALVLALVLVFGCAVGGTLAWLSATSGTVTNTFTVGDISITLQEYPFKNDSTTELDKDATPVQQIDTYKVVPGGKQPKEPFVTVEANSENCYVYVCVTNNLTIDKTIVVTYEINNKWVEIATKTDATTGAVTTLYRYKVNDITNIVETSTTHNQLTSVFTEVTYADTIEKDVSDTALKIGQLKDKTIVLNAYAHQSDNTTQAVADAAAKDHFGFPSAN